MKIVYAAGSADLILTDGNDHALRRALRLRDLPRNPEDWRTEALAASGDFCEMLAVMLEQVAAALPSDSLEQHQIQDAIGQLLYVQRHYKLVKRKSAFYNRPHQRPGDK